MNRLKKISVPILLVFLAASPQIWSQAGSTNAAASSSSPVQSEQVAPSYDTRSSEVGFSGEPASEAGTHKGARTREFRGFGGAVVTPGGVTRLCFQPGIGWRPSPMSNSFATVGPGVPGAPIEDFYGGNVATSRAIEGSLKSAYAQPNHAKQASSDICPITLTSAKVLGLPIEEMNTSEHKGSMTSARSTSMDAGALNWLKATSLINPASAASSQRPTMGLSSTPVGVGYLRTRTGSSSSSKQIDELMERAYVSPIEVRRLSRNTHDLATRIRLERLSRRLEKTRSRSLDEEPLGSTAHESHAQARAKENQRKYGRRDHPSGSHPVADPFGQE